MAQLEERRLRVLIVGAGPAGLRHARNATALGHDAAIARRDGAETDDFARGAGIPVFAGLDAAAQWSPDAVVVANAPSNHVAAARWAVDAGLPSLVEKPLAATPDDVADLLDRARTAGVHLAVGYNLRFHPALRAVAAAVADGRIGRLLFVRAEVGSLLSDWHPESDYRHGSAAQRALGGGALLTLSHELDYVLWIAGPASLVTGAHAHVSTLEADVEDVAEVVLRHETGAMSSVHVDLVDRAYNRRVRCVGESGTITWTWGGQVELGDDVLWSDPNFDLEATYVDELRAFLAGEPAPGDAVQDACRVLAIVEGVLGGG